MPCGPWWWKANYGVTQTQAKPIALLWLQHSRCLFHHYMHQGKAMLIGADCRGEHCSSASCCIVQIWNYRKYSYSRNTQTLSRDFCGPLCYNAKSHSPAVANQHRCKRTTNGRPYNFHCCSTAQRNYYQTDRMLHLAEIIPRPCNSRRAGLPKNLDIHWHQSRQMERGLLLHGIKKQV